MLSFLLLQCFKVTAIILKALQILDLYFLHYMKNPVYNFVLCKNSELYLSLISICKLLVLQNIFQQDLIKKNRDLFS